MSKPNPPAAAPPARAPIEVTCPGCGETTLYSSGNPFRPFCSARCQGQDFGAWASEHYRVPTPPQADDGEA